MNRAQGMDPNGDIAAGKFACFFKNDWDYALGRFAKCTDSKLKELAEMDLGNPKGGEAQLALANGWWDYAQKQTAHAKRMFQARAAYWYKQAVGQIAGLQKVMGEKRILTSMGAPEDAQVFAGHGYFHSDAKLTWHQAKLVCELWGGHLACIESAEEQKFVVSIAERRAMWLGGTDEEEEGKWKWVNGSPFEYTAWHPGEPSNSNGNENYLEYGGGKWNDIPNRPNANGFLCEWE